jgi:pimeloyl-ACP methyl ester carboxylesterase
MSAPVRPKRPANLPADFDDPLRPRNPLVTRRFLLGGIGIMVLASLGALYFAIALLFWQGQWQLIFHPSHIVASTPASKGIPFEDVRFDATETGQTRLDGWWIPADPQLPHQPAAILYLHEARGSLSDALPDLTALHALGYDIFAFDPRGFGKSQWVRPSEKRWIQDSDAALYYLASVRHIGPSHLVLVGRGLGGTIGAGLTLRHAALSSLVMIDPQPPTLHLLEAPRWTHILPVRLLAHDHFDPRHALSSMSLDKLFLLPANGAAPAYIAEAAQPAAIVHSTSLDSPEAVAALRQFIAHSRAARAN